MRMLVVVLLAGGVLLAQERGYEPPPPKRPPAQKRLDERVVEKIERALKEWAPWMMEEFEHALKRRDERFLRKLAHFVDEMSELRERNPREFKERLERMREEFERRHREHFRPPHPPDKEHFRPPRPEEGPEERPPREPRDEDLKAFLKSDRFALLREVAPWLLERALHAEPSELPDIVRGLERMCDDLERLRREDKERFELRVKAMRLKHKAEELAEAFRQTNSPDEKERFRRELKEVLTALFKTRMREMECEMEELARELEHLKGLHDRYLANAEKIIRRKLEEMLEGDEGFEW